MVVKKNLNSILFLFEGDTEFEFYKKLLESKLPSRSIQLHWGNLRGVDNITQKALGKIHSFLDNKKYKDEKSIHVYIAFDREGERHIPSRLNCQLLRHKLIAKKSRIASITEIIATQDLESWFFYDIKGLYKFLNIPKTKQNFSLFKNPEQLNNVHLSHLFHKNGKHYQKGTKTAGLIDKLNLELIYDNIEDLQKAIEAILKQI